jgi:hypothetical protein
MSGRCRKSFTGSTYVHFGVSKWCPINVHPFVALASVGHSPSVLGGLPPRAFALYYPYSYAVITSRLQVLDAPSHDQLK